MFLPISVDPIFEEHWLPELRILKYGSVRHLRMPYSSNLDVLNLPIG